MIHLFVLDNSLTSQRFNTRTEQLTKCCEPLQKMRVRVGACKIDLSPPPHPKLLYITDRSNAIFLLWFRLFYILESSFVLFEPYVRFHIFSGRLFSNLFAQLYRLMSYFHIVKLGYAGI